jgi:hypothetical protein
VYKETKESKEANATSKEKKYKIQKKPINPPLQSRVDRKQKIRKNAFRHRDSLQNE